MHAFSAHPASYARRWIIAPAALAVTALSVPYLLTGSSACLGLALQQGFALVCHQRPERCFWLFGAPVAVCARCLGVYAGAAIGLLGQTSQRVAFRLLLVTASLNLLEGLSEVIGLHGNLRILRFVLGLALGASAGMLLASAQASSTREPANLAPVPR